MEEFYLCFLVWLKFVLEQILHFNISKIRVIFSGIVIGLAVLYFLFVNTLKIRHELKEKHKILLIKQLDQEFKSNNVKIYSHLELSKLKKSRKIVFFDNYIIDVTDFIEHHPGGQIHLIETINQDVSRYLDATAAINPSFDPRSHLVSTYQHIFDSMIIGQFQDNSGLIIKSNKNSDIIDHELSLMSKRKIAKDTYEFKFQFKTKSQDIIFSRFLPGFEWMGRHFAVMINN